MDDVTNRQYFTWLCKKVGFEENYYFLTKRLFSREFYWIVPNDDNRASDGQELRHKYNNEFSQLDWAINVVDGEVTDANLDSPCTVLEMLVGLADRCEVDIMHDDLVGDRTKLWFSEMIKNLGLDGFTDDAFDEHFDEKVNNIIDIFLERKYTRMGVGGIFPLKRTDIYYPDQRTIELWKQLFYWLDENYPL